MQPMYTRLPKQGQDILSCFYLRLFESQGERAHNRGGYDKTFPSSASPSLTNLYGNYWFVVSAIFRTPHGVLFLTTKMVIFTTTLRISRFFRTPTEILRKILICCFCHSTHPPSASIHPFKGALARCIGWLRMALNKLYLNLDNPPR